MTLGKGNKKGLIKAPLFRIFGRHKKAAESSELQAATGTEQTTTVDVDDDDEVDEHFHFVEENPGSPFQRLSSTASSSTSNSNSNSNNNTSSILRQSSYKVKKVDPPAKGLLSSSGSGSKRCNHNNKHHHKVMSRKQTPPTSSTRKLEKEIKELKKMVQLRNSGSSDVTTSAAATTTPAGNSTTPTTGDGADAVVPMGRTWSQAARYNLEGALWRSNSSPRGDGCGGDNTNNNNNNYDMDLEDLKVYEAVAQQLRQQKQQQQQQQQYYYNQRHRQASMPTRMNSRRNDSLLSRVPSDERFGTLPSSGRLLEPLENLLLGDVEDDDVDGAGQGRGGGAAAEEQYLRKHVRFFGSRNNRNKERTLQEEKMNEYNTSDDEVVETWGWELAVCIYYNVRREMCFFVCLFVCLFACLLVCSLLYFNC